MHGLTYKIWCQAEFATQSLKMWKNSVPQAFCGTAARMLGRLTIIETGQVTAKNIDISALF
jgi:hypothetical protein